MLTKLHIDYKIIMIHTTKLFYSLLYWDFFASQYFFLVFFEFSILFFVYIMISAFSVFIFLFLSSSVKFLYLSLVCSLNFSFWFSQEYFALFSITSCATVFLCIIKKNYKTSILSIRLELFIMLSAPFLLIY